MFADTLRIKYEMHSKRRNVFQNFSKNLLVGQIFLFHQKYRYNKIYIPLAMIERNNLIFYVSYFKKYFETDGKHIEY